MAFFQNLGLLTCHSVLPVNKHVHYVDQDLSFWMMTQIIFKDFKYTSCRWQWLWYCVRIQLKRFCIIIGNWGKWSVFLSWRENIDRLLPVGIYHSSFVCEINVSDINLVLLLSYQWGDTEINLLLRLSRSLHEYYL